MVTLEDYKKQLERHDWFYEMADDYRAFQNGAANQSHLLSVAREGGLEFKSAYNTFFVLTFKVSTLPFPDAPLMEQPEQPKPKTENTRMKVKDLLNLSVKDALPLILAGLAVLGASGGAEAAPAGKSDEDEDDKPKKDKKGKKSDEDEDDKPKKDKKGKKSSEDDDDEDEDEKPKKKKSSEDDDDDDNDGPTMEDLRKAVGAATDAGNKKKIVAKLEEYEVEKVTELKKKDWPAFLKFAKKLG